MALMQLELDPTPAAVGVGIYIVVQLLLRALAKPTAQAKLGGAIEKHPEEPESVHSTEEAVVDAVEPAEEPSSEPDVSSGPPRAVPVTAASGRLPIWLLRVMVVGLVFMRMAMLLCGVGGGGPTILYTEGPAQQQTLAANEAGLQPEVFGPANVVGCDKNTSAGRPEGAAQLQTQEDIAGEMQGNTEAFFTVKLTRQAMDYDQEDYIRSAYYGTVMVGTPPLEMTVVFDTGSGHLVLPSMYCHSETCKVHTRYRRSASLTGRDVNNNGNPVVPGKPRDSVTVAFGTGEITGVMVEDVLCVGGLSNPDGPAPTNVTPEQGQPAGCMTLRFIAATQLSEDPFKSFNFDGILGLGLDGLSQSSEFNFMEVIADSIRDSGSLSPKTFGVFLADNKIEDSEIALGGWAKAHLAEDLSWGPVHDPEMGHWIVPVRGIRVDDERLDFCDDGTCRAAVDTGTSLLSVPTATFRELYELLRHPTPLAGHCQGHGPLLHIELDYFTVSLGPKDYAQVRSTGKPAFNPMELEEGNVSKPTHRHDLKCFPMLMTLDLPEPLGPKLFILGEPVLRKYYTVYDAHRKRIGFGRAKHLLGPGREQLLAMAPDLERREAEKRGAVKRARRQHPTMFDVFRWRKALQ